MRCINLIGLGLGLLWLGLPGPAYDEAAWSEDLKSEFVAQPLFLALNQETANPETFSRLPIPKQLELFHELPLYQKVKIWLVGTFELTTDALHIYIGFFAYLIAVVIFRMSPASLSSLIPVLMASVFMESFDLFHDFGQLGFFRWLASLHDVVNTSIIPFTLVMALRSGKDLLRETLSLKH